MGVKIVFGYDSITGEYIGLVKAHESPREPGIYLMPSCTTELEPEAYKEHEIPVWNGLIWEIVEDWRGIEGYVNGEYVEIKDLGPKPSGWSETPPEPTLDNVKQNLKSQILAELDALDLKLARPTQMLVNALLNNSESDAVSVQKFNEFINEKERLRNILEQVNIASTIEELELLTYSHD